jgi:hypothetical protein
MRTITISLVSHKDWESGAYKVSFYLDGVFLKAYYYSVWDEAYNVCQAGIDWTFRNKLPD